MEIIDAHVHVFPNKIASKASQSIADFYDMPVRFDGRLQTVFEAGEKAGISRFLIHSVATTPEQVASINDFIANQVVVNPHKLIGFGALHPKMTAPQIEAEISRIEALGLKGIKIHPDFQRFNLNGREAKALFEVVGSRLPFLIHMGDNRYDYSAPRRLADILDNFPKLRVIAAHFGGWSVWEEAADCLFGRDIYVDTCSSLYALAPAKARQLINGFSPERVIFGSDFPMWDPADELRMLRALSLPESDLAKVCAGNIKRLLGEQ